MHLQWCMCAEKVNIDIIISEAHDQNSRHDQESRPGRDICNCPTASSQLWLSASPKTRGKAQQLRLRTAAPIGSEDQPETHRLASG